MGIGISHVTLQCALCCKLLWSYSSDVAGWHTCNAETGCRCWAVRCLLAIWGCRMEPSSRRSSERGKTRELDALWGYCFGFPFLGRCICSTVAQVILLVEYKLSMCIACSCFTRVTATPLQSRVMNELAAAWLGCSGAGCLLQLGIQKQFGSD